MQDFTAMFVADRRPMGTLTRWLEKYPQVDIVVCLGDLEWYDLRPLLNYSVKKRIGIYGNHCDGEYMNDLKIVNMHGRAVRALGWRWAGLEGSPRYKRGLYQYTETEMEAIIKTLPPVDIIISHTPPRGVQDNQGPAHQGWPALRDYLEKQKPCYIFHGHTYPKTRQTKIAQTTVHYVNGISIIKVQQDGLTLIDTDCDYLD